MLRKRTAGSRIALGAVLFLLLLFSFAAAEKEPVLRISCPSRSSETIVSQSGNAGLMIAVPGFWDPENLILELDGADCLYLGTEQMEIRAGEPADLTAFLNEKVPFYDSRKYELGRITVCQGSDVPAFFLSVDGKMLKAVQTSKANEITEGGAVYYEADGTVAYEGGITQLKGRGQNTFAYRKKPYQVRLEKKAALSGMAKAKTWVLLANWNDVSLLRNQLVLDMARETGLRYAVSCVPADVWINGIYQGLYLMTEKIQIKPERMALRDLEEETNAVNDAPADSFSVFKSGSKTLPLVRGYRIPENPADITGGYIAVIEKHGRLRDYKVPGFRTANNLSIRIVEPTCPSQAQVEYLGNLVSEMQLALMAEDGVNPETGKSYREYIDVNSFALKYLIEDWCKNYDFIGGSQYLYKDADSRDPLIYAGPAWDYDLSFGNMEERGNGPLGNYVTSMSRKPANSYWLLSQHDDFILRLRETWRDAFRPALAVLLGESEPDASCKLRSIDAYAEAIRSSAAMNYAAWGVSTTTYSAAGQSFEIAVSYLKQWIRSRTDAMDGNYGNTEKHE